MSKKKIIILSIIVVFLIGCAVFLKVLNVAVKYRFARNFRMESLNKYVSELNESIADRVPIIAYHRIVDHDTKVKYFVENEWVNDLDEVEKELKYLYDNGWKTITLDNFYSWYLKDTELDKKSFIITVDDGDIEAYYNLLPLLDKYNFDATVFVIGSMVPEVTPELNEPDGGKIGEDVINKLREENSHLYFESHTYGMHNEKNGKYVLKELSINEMANDFKSNEKFGFKYLAYPYGYYNNDLLAVISSRSDIKMAFGFYHDSYANRLNYIYEIDRIMITADTSFDEFKKWFDYVN